MEAAFAAIAGMAAAFAAIAGMASAGQALVIHGRLIPLHIVDAAALLRATDSYVAEPPIPMWLQKMAYSGLVAMARRLGYRLDVARYRDVSVLPRPV